jgi:hypothetical protein
MPITLHCPKCQTLLRVADQFPGRLAVCPRCSTRRLVPVAVAVPESSESVPEALPVAEPVAPTAPPAAQPAQPEAAPAHDWSYVDPTPFLEQKRETAPGEGRGGFSKANTLFDEPGWTTVATGLGLLQISAWLSLVGVVFSVLAALEKFNLKVWRPEADLSALALLGFAAPLIYLSPKPLHFLLDTLTRDPTIALVRLHRRRTMLSSSSTSVHSSSTGTARFLPPIKSRQGFT